MSDFQHVFRVLTASLLQAPGRLVPEVQGTWERLGTTTFLSKEQTIVYISVGSKFALQSIHAYVVFSDVSWGLKVIPSVFTYLSCVWLAAKSYGYIDDNVFLILNYLFALIYCRVNVQIPHCATIHEHVAVPVPRLKCNWNWTWSKCASRQIFKRAVVLVHCHIITGLDIDSSLRKPTFDWLIWFEILS